MQFDMEHIRLSTKEYIGNDFNLSVSKNVVSENFMLHWHDFFEIEFIIRGKGEQILNGTLYELKKGDIYLLKSTDFHEIRVKENITISKVMFNENLISPALLEQCLASKENLFFHLDSEEFERMSALFDQLLFEFESDNVYKKECVKNLLECIFILILRKRINPPYRFTYDSDNSVKKALFYLHGHFRENPCMRDVSEKIGLNPNYFCEIFHRETGQTYKKYVNELKLNYAKNLLLSCDLPITDICYNSGFITLSHFLREFKNKFKKTPSEIKKENTYHNKIN